MSNVMDLYYTKRHFEAHAQYFPRYKLIYIHIPKCGGTSMCHILKRITKTSRRLAGHTPMQAYQKFIGEDEGESVSFSFIRNPWSRAVSSYFYLKKMKEDRNHKHYWRILKSPKSFKEYCKRLKTLKKEELKKLIHLRPQMDYIKCKKDYVVLDQSSKDDVIKNLLQSTILLKLEDLSANINTLADILTNHTQKSFKDVSKIINTKMRKTNHSDYKHYYTSETRKIIEELYKDDIVGFGYTFKN